MRLIGRLAATELVLTCAEVLLCGGPLVLWAGGFADPPWATRVALPLVLAGIVAALLRSVDLLRPVVAVVRAKQRQEAASPEALDLAARALTRAPRQSAALRFVVWAAVVASVTILALERGVGDRTLAAGVGLAVLLQAAGVAGARLLLLERALEPARPVVMPYLEGIRVFAAAYRRWLPAGALAVVGGAHALLLLAALAFTNVAAVGLARLGLLLWPPLVCAALLWSRSFLRRTTAIDQFFEATLRAPGTRGPARDEPRAVTAFAAAQALPYRLAGYGALSLALAGVLAIAVTRRLDGGAGGLAVAQAGRLLGALAVTVLAAGLTLALLLRSALRPLIRHIGSRHILPAAAVRARVGLGPKLLVCFTAVAGISAGGVALAASAPVGHGAVAALALIVVLGLAVTLGALIVREVVAPLRALEERSEDMARGELARPVPPSGEADEIGRLTSAFEEMRRSLRDRLRSTESINIDLEREVRRRTEVLEQRNAELREALDKLRRAQDNLIRSEKLASMGRLVAGIAHEINNPVNAVINSLGPLDDIVRQIAVAQDAAQAGGLARDAEEMLAVIQRGATRTKAIVQALHNYSRGDESVQREVNLARSVDDALDLLRHRLRDLKVVRDVDPAARILGFPGQIDQVLLNLITNAAQALGPGGGTIQVGVRCQGQAVVVAVADDGPGIPAEILPRIFDPFFTTKAVGEGSGLGLSIVHGIVERHGGRIEVDSAPGRGTTFRLTFPLPTAHAAAAGTR